MTVAEHIDPATGLASGRTPHDGPLRVDGLLPLGLDGVLVLTGPRPGGPARPYGSAGPSSLSGVRLGGGTARWHRAAAEKLDGHPLVQARGSALWSRPAGPSPDGPCAASVALPVQDRAAGEWHTVATYPGLDLAEHLVIGPDGGVRDWRPFALDGAPLMQAVALTERFVVVFDLPVTYRRAAAMVGAASPYRWQRDRPARIGLLPRHGGGEPQWFPIAPCFVSHAVNAYDDGGSVVVDAVRHDRAFDASTRDRDGATGSPRVHRWTLDIAGGTARERELTGPLDLASADPRRTGLRHQLIFGRDPGGRALIGHDLAAESTQVRELGPGWRAGRPVFVPRGVAEGDGWIVALATNAALGMSELLVLDAMNLAGRPQAVVHLPVIPPAAQHTTWVPASTGHARHR
ncbi:carotenoid oxygenase family protein [Sphaerisporangium flaviroseum]|uniref:Dioxygenase n=1 Tax=Sphaerisporangium flaviroseum TaxID=509199 RepID=A0ABP7IL04_9ACTN